MLDSFDFTQSPLPPLILKTHSCPLFSWTWWNLIHWNAHPTRLGLDNIPADPLARAKLRSG